jgi:hypothetical protein
MSTRISDRLSLLVSMLLGIAVATPASAATVTLCAEYQVAYQDSNVLTTPDTDLEGDYFYTNSNKVARGARIRVVRSDGAVKSKFASDDGADAGCATFTLDHTETFDVLIISEAEVNGNTVKVKDAPGGSLFASNAVNTATNTLMQSWSPSAGTSTVDIETNNPHNAWNAAAAAGHALWRRHVGLANKTFDLYLDDSCSSGGSCHRDGNVHLGDDGLVKRFIIVHELGHAVEHFLTQIFDGDSDVDADVDDCYTVVNRNHELNSKEWQSAAIREGWAQFYAAVAFNQTTDPACGFVYYKEQDYDLLNGAEADDPHALSCEQGPNNLFGNPSPPVVDAKDYLGDFCAATGSVDGRATELDWLRFWWDFMQENTTVSVTDCGEILATAIDGDWGFPLYGAWVDNATSATAAQYRPAWRMRTSAAALGLATEWDAHAVDNGVHR